MDRLDIPILAVLLFGFANLFADGVSMGLGDFLSSKSEQQVYSRAKRKEAYEIKHDPEKEAMESVIILKHKGFSETDAQSLISIYRKNPSYWLRFVMNEKLELPNVENDRPLIAAITTFFSFLVFGFIPLIPYLFFRNADTFQVAAMATVGALLILGFLRSRVSSLSPIRTIGETLLAGGAASIIAYLVGVIFRA